MSRYNNNNLYGEEMVGLKGLRFNHSTDSLEVPGRISPRTPRARRSDRSDDYMGSEWQQWPLAGGQNGDSIPVTPLYSRPTTPSMVCVPFFSIYYTDN